MFEAPPDSEEIIDDPAPPEPDMHADPEAWLEYHKLRAAKAAFDLLVRSFTMPRAGQNDYLLVREANAYLARILPEIKIEQKSTSIVDILKEIKDIGRNATRHVSIPVKPAQKG